MSEQDGELEQPLGVVSLKLGFEPPLAGEKTAGTVHLRISQARNLTIKEAYVKLYLSVDGKDLENTKQKTKHIKSESPTFDESFVFYLPAKTVFDENNRLQVSLWNHGGKLGAHDSVGGFSFSLEEISHCNNDDLTLSGWFEVLETKDGRTRHVILEESDVEASSLRRSSSLRSVGGGKIKRSIGGSIKHKLGKIPKKLNNAMSGSSSSLNEAAKKSKKDSKSKGKEEEKEPVQDDDDDDEAEAMRFASRLGVKTTDLRGSSPKHDSQQADQGDDNEDDDHHHHSTHKHTSDKKAKEVHHDDSDEDEEEIHRLEEERIRKEQAEEDERLQREQEAEEMARIQKKKENEEKLKKEKKEAEERAKKEAEEKSKKKDADLKAKKEADERLKKEAEEKAKKDKKDAEEKAKKDKKEAEERAKKEAEEKEKAKKAAAAATKSSKPELKAPTRIVIPSDDDDSEGSHSDDSDVEIKKAQPSSTSSSSPLSSTSASTAKKPSSDTVSSKSTSPLKVVEGVNDKDSTTESKGRKQAPIAPTKNGTKGSDSEKEGYENQIKALQEELRKVREEMEDLEEENAHLNSKVKEMNQIKALNEQLAEDCEKANEEIQELNDQHQRDRQELEQKIRILKDSKAGGKTASAPVSNDTSALEAENFKLRETVRSLEAKISTMGKNNSAMKGSNASIASTVTMEEENRELKARLKEMEHKHENLMSDLDDENKALRAHIDHLTVQLIDLDINALARAAK